MKLKNVLLPALAIIALGLTACTQEQETEEAMQPGQELEGTAERMGKEVDQAIDAAQETMQQAGERIGETLNRTGEQVEEQTTESSQ